MTRIALLLALTSLGCPSPKKTCAVNSDCVSGYVCDATSGQCVQEQTPSSTSGGNGSSTTTNSNGNGTTTSTMSTNGTSAGTNSTTTTTSTGTSTGTTTTSTTTGSTGTIGGSGYSLVGGISTMNTQPLSTSGYSVSDDGLEVGGPMSCTQSDGSGFCYRGALAP